MGAGGQGLGQRARGEAREREGLINKDSCAVTPERKGWREWQRVKGDAGREKES